MRIPLMLRTAALCITRLGNAYICLSCCYQVTFLNGKALLLRFTRGNRSLWTRHIAVLVGVYPDINSTQICPALRCQLLETFVLRLHGCMRRA